MAHPTGRLYVLVGLPGSGKTTFLARAFAKDHPDVLVLDDYQAGAISDRMDPAWSRHRPVAIAELRDGGSVLVSDITYCNPSSFARLVALMREDVPGLEVEGIYFENDPDAACHNVRLRARETVDREIALLHSLTTVYRPPAGSMPITRGV